MSPRQLTREDAREIIENMTGFFSVLLAWELDDRKKRQAEDASAHDQRGASQESLQDGPEASDLA